MSMTLSDTVLCQGTYITMSSNYTGIGLTGNVCDFGNGDSIKDKNPVSYAYLGTGTFNIKHNAQYRVCNSVSISRKVMVIPQPNLDLGPDTTICVGNEAITISDDRNAANPTAQWLWNTGSTSNSIKVTTPGVYAVKLNLSNCTTTDSLIVREDCYMHIPNVFSPNDDGVNDFFCPRNLIAKGLVKFKMSIYNRWGQLIFETINIDGRGWDGKFNGLPQTQGVYVYKIDAIFRDGTSENRTGNVTLLR
jgi:gliding motility-associated-like protein